jgi:SP family sugar:H+ symporter-like MFS transporter
LYLDKLAPVAVPYADTPLSIQRRTTIAILAMFFQQITGQAFVSQYSVVFYQREGITNSFQLGLIGSCAGLVCTIFTSLVVDGFGRRPILLAGGSLMAIVLFIFGGIGTIGDPSDAEKHLMVACNILFGCFYGLSWAPLSYVVLGEVAATRVKEKTNNLAVCISVITTFVISFTIPYLLNAPYANLGAKVGFIYGSTTVLSVVCAYLFIPEMKGLSLEQINVLFRDGVPTRRFKEVAKGMGADFETQEIEVRRAKLGSDGKTGGNVDERSIVSGS